MYFMPLVAAAILASTQQPAQKYAEGQQLRVCGPVVTARANPSTCETILRVQSAGEEFEVLIPASLQKQMTTDPQRLRGAEACFSGRVTPASGAVRITAATAEVTATPPGPSFGEGAVLPCGGAVTFPQIVKEQKPQYTQATLKAGISGSVEMEVVVDVDGGVSAARVIKTLHPELDEQALNAVKEWKFSPGVMNGKPVPVLVMIEMTFTTRSRQ